MFQQLLTISDKPLDTAIRALSHVIDADDLRWLSAYIAIELLNQHVETRGNDYLKREPGTALRLVIGAIAALDIASLITFMLVVDMFYKVLSPAGAHARDYVEIRTITHPYPQYDLETGLQQTDDNVKPNFIDFDYPYVYVRLYAGKGNTDHTRAKWLSIYADRGSGTVRDGEGFGGYVAKGLAEGLITEDQVLDAWHASKAAYAEFVDGVETIVKFLTPTPNQDKSRVPPKKSGWMAHPHFP